MGGDADAQGLAPLPRIAIVLGAAGLLPQAACSLLAVMTSDSSMARAIGLCYAALILSFLGGLWWGIAASVHQAPKWLFGVAVVPSLVAFADMAGWVTNIISLTGALGIMAIGLGAAPLIDKILFGRGLVALSLFRLRIALSGGLGLLTLVLASS